MAPIIQAARRSPDLDVRICVTGQHRELLDQVLNFFCICPDHDLAVMSHNQDLNSLTSTILFSLRPVLLAERPDMVLVQGDTISAFTGALAAFFEHIPVGHIEAGLRTHNLSSPFPEEAMRQIVTRLASVHFAPTQANAETLVKEGVRQRSIHVTGNPGIDAVLWARDKVRRSRVNPLSAHVEISELRRIEQSEHIVLVTAHRRENFGRGLRELCDAIGNIAAHHPESAIVFPVHPNPNVRGPVVSEIGGIRNVFLLSPLDYPAFVHLMDISSCIVTDSGGVQEEAPALAKPVIVTRSSTERMEGLTSGASYLTGAVAAAIVNAVESVLRAPTGAKPAIAALSPFGDGRAAERIVHTLEQQTFVADRGTASLQALMRALGTTTQPANAVTDVANLESYT
jgi:UDP-N-acetylglucosamine 2-epimerase (non-hydrolysing)